MTFLLRNMLIFLVPSSRVHCAVRVRPVSAEEAVAITEVRMVVEGLRTAKAAERISDTSERDGRPCGE